MIAYRCCYCYYWNPARKQRPTAPKLATGVQRQSSTESTSEGELRNKSCGSRLCTDHSFVLDDEPTPKTPPKPQPKQITGPKKEVEAAKPKQEMKEVAEKEVKDATDKVNGDTKTSGESSEEPEMKVRDEKSSGDSEEDESEKKED